MRYCISDIHGCLRTFLALLEKLNLDKENDTLYILGDLIDRGQDSAQVVQHVLNMREQGYTVICLRGNHEDFLLKAARLDDDGAYWVVGGNGGMATLRSYGIEKSDIMIFWNKIPKTHQDFYKSLPVILEEDDVVLVHAGLDFHLKNPIDDTRAEVMMWDRDFVFDAAKMRGKTLITGHTPRPSGEVFDSRNDAWVNIDGGAYFVNHNGLGYMLALRLEDRELFWQPNIELPVLGSGPYSR